MAGEMAVHTWFKGYLKKKYGKKCIYIKTPAGIYSSRRGISDFICCIHGVYTAIEVKAERGMQPTLIQQDFLDSVIAAGGVGICLDGKNTAILDFMHQEIISKLGVEIDNE